MPAEGWDIRFEGLSISADHSALIVQRLTAAIFIPINLAAQQGASTSTDHCAQQFVAIARDGVASEAADSAADQQASGAIVLFAMIAAIIAAPDARVVIDALIPRIVAVAIPIPLPVAMKGCFMICGNGGLASKSGGNTRLDRRRGKQADREGGDGRGFDKMLHDSPFFLRLGFKYF